MNAMSTDRSIIAPGVTVWTPTTVIRRHRPVASRWPGRVMAIHGRQAMVYVDVGFKAFARTFPIEQLEIVQ